MWVAPRRPAGTVPSTCALPAHLFARPGGAPGRRAWRTETTREAGAPARGMSGCGFGVTHDAPLPSLSPRGGRPAATGQDATGDLGVARGTIESVKNQA